MVVLKIFKIELLTTLNTHIDINIKWTSPTTYSLSDQ